MQRMQPAKQDCHGAGPHDSLLTLGSLIETHSLFFCFFFPSLIQFWTLTGHMWCVVYACNVCSQLGKIVMVLALMILSSILALSLKPTLVFFSRSLIQFWTLTGHMWCILYTYSVPTQCVLFCLA